MSVTFGAMVVEVSRDRDLSLANIVPQKLRRVFEEARLRQDVENLPLGQVAERTYSLTLNGSRTVLRITPVGGKRLAWRAVREFEARFNLRNDMNMIVKPEDASDEAIQAQIEKNIAEKRRWAVGIRP